MWDSGLYVELGPRQYHLFKMHFAEVPVGAAHRAGRSEALGSATEEALL